VNELSAGIDDPTLAALRRHCRRAQEQVYRRYARSAWTLALRLSGCDATAWDAVQGGFLRAFEHIGQLQQAAQFGSWLRRIVVNQVMDAGRRRLVALPGDLEQATAGGDAGQSLDLLRALDRLSTDDRAVLWLHDAEGMTHGEIAAALQRSVPWSKTRLSRVRGRMRELLGESAPLSAAAGIHAEVTEP
jgi:RNA polymerase sigma-70 factor (ECF subfamily)